MSDTEPETLLALVARVERDNLDESLFYGLIVRTDLARLRAAIRDLSVNVVEHAVTEGCVVCRELLARLDAGPKEGEE